MTSLAVRRPAANTTSIREGYVSSPRRNIYSASVNLSAKVLDFVQFGGPEFTARDVREWFGRSGGQTLYVGPASPPENG